MKTKWLVADILGDDIEKLISSLDKTGTKYKRISKSYEVNLPDLFDRESCVVYYGSLGVGFQVRSTCPWVPGIYSTTENYECTKYYPVFGSELFNANYIMLPYGELLRQKEFLYDTIGQKNTVFIRPNDAVKSFTGKLVYKEHFEKDVEYMGFNQLSKDKLVVVAEPRNIVREWRFIVVDGNIIAGSLYSDQFRGNRLHREEDVFSSGEHAKALMYAEQIVQDYDYKPDRAWSLDICEDLVEDLYVLEVGCFSCCGLYASNTDVIVKEINRIALDDWGECYG